MTASAPIFAALGDDTRLRLVIFPSAAGPSSTATLIANVDVSYQGRDSVWQIESSQLEEAQRCIELLTTRWHAAIDRLRTLVEEG